VDILSWSQIVLVCFLGAASPGPSLALVSANTLSGGRAYGIATSLGHAIGIGLWALLTAIGLAKVIVSTPAILIVAQLFGGCLVSYIGFRIISGKPGPSGSNISPPTSSSKTLIQGAVEGFLISILNPKIALFFLAIFSHFVEQHMGWTATGLLSITVASIDAGWYVAVTLTLTKAGMISLLQIHSSTITKTSGTLLILIGFYLFCSIILSTL